MEIRATITPTGITKTELHVSPEAAAEGQEFFARVRPLLLEIHRRIERGETSEPAKSITEAEPARPVKDFLTPAETAEFLGISQHTLAAWRWRGKGPAFHKLGASRNSLVRYWRKDIEDSLRRGATSAMHVSDKCDEKSPNTERRFHGDPCENR